MPFVDDADVELVVKFFYTLLELFNYLLVVWVQVVSGEASRLHVVHSPHEGDEGSEMLRHKVSKGVHMV